MGKYKNLRDKAFKLTLDAGGREFLEVKIGIDEYDDKIARRFPTMLQPVVETKAKPAKKVKVEPVLEKVEKPVIKVVVENAVVEGETPEVEEVEPVIDPEKVIVEEPVLIKESENKPKPKKKGRKKGSKNKKKVDKVEVQK